MNPVNHWCPQALLPWEGPFIVSRVVVLGTYRLQQEDGTNVGTHGTSSTYAASTRRSLGNPKSYVSTHSLRKFCLYCLSNICFIVFLRVVSHAWGLWLGHPVSAHSDSDQSDKNISTQKFVFEHNPIYPRTTLCHLDLLCDWWLALKRRKKGLRVDFLTTRPIQKLPGTRAFLQSINQNDKTKFIYKQM